MRFAFTDEQLELRAQLRQVLDDRCRPADVRQAWETASGWSGDRWETLAGLGVTGLTVPEDHGGLGLGLVDLVGLLEELGWAAAPEPVAETVAVAVPLLVDLAAAAPGGPAVAAVAGALSGVASGQVVLAMAVPGSPPAAPLADPTPPVVVDGRPDAATACPVGPVEVEVSPSTAGLFVVPVGDGVHLARPDQVAVTGHRSLDGSRRPGTLRLDPCTLDVLCAGPAAERAVRRATARAAAATGALLLGLGARLLAMATAYATDRRQFGHPIGSYQAVKHLLADVAVRLEHARPAVYRASWSLDHDAPTAVRDTSMAKALATEAASEAARAALQVHGAIGYTWEHDLHLWMKRVWALAPAWGDAAAHRARVLAEVQAELAGRRPG